MSLPFITNYAECVRSTHTSELIYNLYISFHAGNKELVSFELFIIYNCLKDEQNTKTIAIEKCKEEIEEFKLLKLDNNNNYNKSSS